MSSSRRRGRPPGAPANSQPPTLTASQSEVADALLAEASADKGQKDESRQSEQEPETEVTEVAAVEAAAEPPAGDAAAEAAASSAEPAAESAHVGAQAAEDDQPGEPPAQDAVEAAAVPDGAPAAEPIVSEAAETVAETVGTVAEATNETLARTLAETALLPGLAEAKPSEDAAPRSHSVHIGASFAFVPTLAPITEINAKLFAFARGEGEAALSHFQALARAKSPAEVLRLQVTEMQRAADASLTCFSEIVRSASRLSDSARRH